MDPETDLALNLFAIRFRLALLERAFVSDDRFDAIGDELFDELNKAIGMASVDLDRICAALKQLGVAIPPSLESMRSVEDAKTFAALIGEPIEGANNEEAV